MKKTKKNIPVTEKSNINKTLKEIKDILEKFDRRIKNLEFNTNDGK